jgi:DNA-binding transcriptional LysR family regulator
MMLDLQSVRSFVLAAQYGNMTRAAEAMGTVQPVVSQRIKALEIALAVKLFDRTSRFVRLTSGGASFLARAQHLLAAHDAAVAPLDGPAAHVFIAMSDHTLGASFHLLLAQLRAALPSGSSVSLRLGLSSEMRKLFDEGEVDLAIIRRDNGEGDGEVLGEDPVQWWAASDYSVTGHPLPLVVLPEPCGVRMAAIKALERAALPWREAFVGGSCLALAAAVRAGLGVAPLGRIVGGQLSGCVALRELPEIRPSQIVLLARTPSPILASAARALSAGVRGVMI